MNDINDKIIDAIIKKADALCPDSLALIGVYGSAITGDGYEKSDLDLMILVNDQNGQVLADGFIIDDVDIGYDLYCTSWDMLEKDAQCGHAHLSKLFDSMIVYCKDKSALKRLDGIRRKAAGLLASDKRYEKAGKAYSDAKTMLAEVYLTQSLSKARSCAGAAIEFIENAVMLHNGQYFKKGTKRALDELKQLRLPFDLETRILAVIQAETVEKIRAGLTELFVLTDGYLQVPKKKELPSAENLRGTYEEMYSNWKNKMSEAAGSGDVYSSFMNLLSLQWMFHEISECIAVYGFEIMDKFNPKNLEENVDVFDQALNKYLAEYEKAGIYPKHFKGMAEFAEDYNKEISVNIEKEIEIYGSGHIMNKEILLSNIDNLHTTEMGIDRIKKNLKLDTDDVVEWCKTKIKSVNAVITRSGKNWYVNVDSCIITVNAYSYTIITAHREKK